MISPLKVLLIEDDEHDAELVVRALTKNGLGVSYMRIESEEAMRRWLTEGEWDVIIADYSLPSFSALLALRTMHDMELDLPFIIVSGTVDEETAVEAIRAGAHDFMAKGQYARLLPAIEREMREVGVRAERTKIRQQLLISDRMASIGTLAAGVAHEINNPLTSVIGGLDLALEEITVREGRSDERTQKLLTDAREAAERVRAIVRDLKAFSRSDDETTGPVDLELAIDASIRMVNNEVRHRARLTTRYGSVPPVEGNEARLGQVFLNLIINAAQAMEGNTPDDNEIVVATTTTDDGRVCVEVRDNGPGIPKEIRDRIFDPFFTTKPIGKGTGLGLAICHRIINELGGEIRLETGPQGTTFHTYLPISTTSQSERPKTERPPARAAGSAETRILVIDDEPAIATIAGRILSKQHEVTVVSQPRKALELLRSEATFDVILCDLMMPDVTGIEIYHEVSKIEEEHRPRIAFMTGGAFTKEARDFLDRVPCPRLAKPFDRKALNRLIETLLCD